MFHVQQRAAEKIIGQATKAECRVAIMVAVMILAFLTAWMPYSVLALMIAFGGVHVSPVVSIIPALCAKSSICWNPIIYIGLNTQVNYVDLYQYYCCIHNILNINRKNTHGKRISEKKDTR